MTTYNATVAVTYECRGADDTLYEQSDTLYLIVEGDSADADYSSEIEAWVEANRPNNCAGRPIYSYTIEPTDFPTQPDFPPDAPTFDDTGELVDVGELVTVEGLVTLDCVGGQSAFRTVHVDVTSQMTRGEVEAALQDEAEALISGAPDNYPCVISSIKIVGPVYFLFMKD